MSKDDIAKEETKEELLLRRVFKAIAVHHFEDHKMINNYCGPVRFPRQLGQDIANFVKGRDPKYFQSTKKQIESGDHE